MIPFADCSVTDPLVINTLADVLRSGKFINGQYNNIFSTMWSRECNTIDCILTSSGTTALIAALKCNLRGRQNNYVVLPALSFAATAFAVIEAGCVPVYVDVDERGLINWRQVREAVYHYGNKVHAIIPVHLYGQVTSIPQAIAEKCYVIQDAAQAHGVIDTPDIACFSFYPSKNLGAIGDAGAVVTNNVELGERIRAYINYGDPPGEKYKHAFQGTNLRCDEIQAAYLTIAYVKLEATNKTRANIASIYERGGVSSLANSTPSSWHLYPILVDNPGLFRRVMYDYGIETGNHYPYMLPELQGAEGICYGDCHNAERIRAHVVTLPIGPHMTSMDANHVVGVINDVAELRDELWCIKENL